MALRSLSLADFAGALDGARPGTSYVRGRCPFGEHVDEDPSLVVYGGDEPHWHCYGCKRHGYWEELWEALDGGPVQYPERAVTETVERGPWYRPSWYQAQDMNQYVADAHDRLAHNVHLQWYLDERALTRGLRRYRLGYDEGWLVIPIYLPSGRLDGVVARAYPEQAEKAEMRYDLPRNQGRLMYVPSWGQWQEADVVYVTSGVIDAISLSIAGLTAATATTGKDSFSPRWINDDRMVAIVYDREEDQSALELATRFRHRPRVLDFPYVSKEKDMNDVLVNRGKDELKRLVLACWST